MYESEEDRLRKKKDKRNAYMRDRRARINALRGPQPSASELLMGNKNAQKYTDKDIAKIVKKVKELAPGVCSIVEIIANLEISQRNYYDLVDRYPAVSAVHDLAKNYVSTKAWKQSYEGKGFPNILQMAIKRHDRAEVNSHLKELIAIEKAKSDIRIREKKEIADNERKALIEEVKSLTPEQALAIISLSKNKEED